MKTKIYKAQIIAPFGSFIIAVDSTEHDARTDIITAALTEFNCPVGMIRIKGITSSNRHLINNMFPIDKAQVNNQIWGWIRKI